MSEEKGKKSELLPLCYSMYIKNCIYAEHLEIAGNQQTPKWLGHSVHGQKQDV